jgi:ankyrin repeat protein
VKAFINKDDSKSLDSMLQALDGDDFKDLKWPLFQHCIERSSVQCLSLLIQLGCDVNFAAERDGNTALHQAANRNDKKLVKCLLDYGASLYMLNNAGKRPKELATDRKVLEFIAEVEAEAEAEAVAGERRLVAVVEQDDGKN